MATSTSLLLQGGLACRSPTLPRSGHKQHGQGVSVGAWVGGWADARGREEGGK